MQVYPLVVSPFKDLVEPLGHGITIGVDIPVEANLTTICRLGKVHIIGEELPKLFDASNILLCKAGLEMCWIRSLLSPTDLRCLQFLIRLRQRVQRARYALKSF